MVSAASSAVKQRENLNVQNVKFLKKKKVTVSSLRQPEFEGSVVGAGGDQFSVRGHVHTHHLPLVSCERLQRGPARVAPDLRRVVVGSRQEEVSVCGCVQSNTASES